MTNLSTYIQTPRLISPIVRWVFLVCMSAWVSLLSFSLLPTSTYAQLDNTNNPFTNPKNSGSAEKLGVVGLVDAGEDDGGRNDALINVIKWFINWTLGILWLIALLVLLYGWFRMVTAAGNEDQYGEGMKILKQAAFGLVMIGLAWFIVSMIFFVISLTTSNAGDDAGTITNDAVGSSGWWATAGSTSGGWSWLWGGGAKAPAPPGNTAPPVRLPTPEKTTPLPGVPGWWWAGKLIWGGPTYPTR